MSNVEDAKGLESALGYLRQVACEFNLPLTVNSLNLAIEVFQLEVNEVIEKTVES